MQDQSFFLHLVSDSTGETLHGVARACVAQFEGVDAREKFWNLVRNENHLKRVLEGIENDPGPVLFTIVDRDLRRQLKDFCRELKIPCVPVLEPTMRELSSYLGVKSRSLPGLQHQMNEEYFDRIEAVDFTLQHDDGRDLDNLGEADVILIGVSRTSKTPTCIYLSNRGVKAANIPLVPGVDIPQSILTLKGPLYIGLTESPDRLEALRKNRLNTGNEGVDKGLQGNNYLSIDAIEEEVRRARRLFSDHNWPVIDVTRRSVEETSAEILTLLNRHKSKQSPRKQRSLFND